MERSKLSIRKRQLENVLEQYPNKSSYCKTQLKSRKSNHSFNDSKRRTMALSSSQKLTALLKKITSKHNGDFYCFNCLLLFTKEHKLESPKKIM